MPSSRYPHRLSMSLVEPGARRPFGPIFCPILFLIVASMKKERDKTGTKFLTTKTNPHTREVNRLQKHTRAY